ncbi:MAG: hypothetical protein HFG80_11815 [Eubacterium sp.]|nr:hypothetical protein [Eubacterium sp.]
MELKMFYGKKVRIISMNGKKFQGKVTDYFYPEDNEPEMESIAIDDIFSGNAVEFPESDIKSIEIIS